MIDKSMRKATAKRCGNVIVIHMDGGGDCLWLNMYLDNEAGQMVCDSDIGSYAYQWGNNDKEDWPKFWCSWLSNAEWLLRKCCGERRAEKAFDAKASTENLKIMYAEMHGGDYEAMYEYEKILQQAEGFYTKTEFAAALTTAADNYSVELPEEWWDFLVEHYTPQQLRFAEICREVIVPALRMLGDKEAA